MSALNVPLEDTEINRPLNQPRPQKKLVSLGEEESRQMFKEAESFSSQTGHRELAYYSVSVSLLLKEVCGQTCLLFVIK